VVNLAENVAENIARLNRRSPARNAYDLAWVARTPGLDLDRPLIRRLAVLKAWVDLHGLATDHATRSAPLPDAQPFDAVRWLTRRTARDFDDESIGLLTVPPPDLDTLGRDLSRLYQWLTDEVPITTSAVSVKAGLVQAALRPSATTPAAKRLAPTTESATFPAVSWPACCWRRAANCRPSTARSYSGL
jgi:hypothetical protein